MPAEYECAVCHHPIFDAAATHALGDAERTCGICRFLAPFDDAAQARIREFIQHPIMPPGYGRAELRRVYPERAHGVPLVELERSLGRNLVAKKAGAE